MEKLSLFLFATALAAQTTVTVKNPVVSPDALVAIQNFMVTQNTGVQTVTTNAMLVGDLTIKVNDATVVNNGDLIIVEGEAMTLSGKSGKTFNVTRGDLGTTPAAHANGVYVQQGKYSTVSNFFLSIIQQTVASIMDTANYPTKVQQDAIITQAQAAKAAAKDAAIK